MSAELDKFITDLHNSLAKVLGEDTTHITQDDLGKGDSPTGDMLVVDLKDGHKRVVVDAEEAMALTRELEGVRGGRPIPFGVVGKARDGSWWVLAEVLSVDGKKKVTALCDESVERGCRHIAELADMRGNRRVVFDEVARDEALPLHADAMTLMAIFAKDSDLERTGSLRWVQMIQDKVGTLFEKKERARCLPNALSLQDSLDRYPIQPIKPLTSLVGISACPTSDPVIKDVLERIARDTSYNGIVPWPRLSGIKYVFASAYEQCVGALPRDDDDTYENRGPVKLALRLLASMPELMANLPKDHVAVRILSRPQGQVDDQDFKKLGRIIGSSGGFETILAALLKMAGAHPGELGSVALTTWTHPSKPDMLLKCGVEVMDKLTGYEGLRLTKTTDDHREDYFQTYIDQVFRTRRLLGLSRYVRLDVPTESLSPFAQLAARKQHDNKSEATELPSAKEASPTEEAQAAWQQTQQHLHGIQEKLWKIAVECSEQMAKYEKTTVTGNQQRLWNYLEDLKDWQQKNARAYGMRKTELQDELQKAWGERLGELKTGQEELTSVWKQFVNAKHLSMAQIQQLKEWDKKQNVLNTEWQMCKDSLQQKLDKDPHLPKPTARRPAVSASRISNANVISLPAPSVQGSIASGNRFPSTAQSGTLSMQSLPTAQSGTQRTTDGVPEGHEEGPQGVQTSNSSPAADTAMGDNSLGDAAATSTSPLGQVPSGSTARRTAVSEFVSDAPPGTSMSASHVSKSTLRPLLPPSVESGMNPSADKWFPEGHEEGPQGVHTSDSSPAADTAMGDNSLGDAAATSTSPLGQVPSGSTARRTAVSEFVSDAPPGTSMSASHVSKSTLRPLLPPSVESGMNPSADKWFPEGHEEGPQGVHTSDSSPAADTAMGDNSLGNIGQVPSGNTIVAPDLNQPTDEQLKVENLRSVQENLLGRVSKTIAEWPEEYKQRDHATGAEDLLLQQQKVLQTELEEVAAWQPDYAAASMRYPALQREMQVAWHHRLQNLLEWQDELENLRINREILEQVSNQQQELDRWQRALEKWTAWQQERVRVWNVWQQDLQEDLRKLQLDSDQNENFAHQEAVPANTYPAQHVTEEQVVVVNPHETLITQQAAHNEHAEIMQITPPQTPQQKADVALRKAVLRHQQQLLATSDEEKRMMQMATDAEMFSEMDGADMYDDDVENQQQDKENIPPKSPRGRPTAGGAERHWSDALNSVQDLTASSDSLGWSAPKYKAHIVVAHGKGLPFMLTWTKGKWSDPKGIQTITLRESHALSDACETQNTLTVIFRLDPGQCVELDSQRV